MKLFNDLTPGGLKMATGEAQDGLLATLGGTQDFLCQRRLRFRPTPCQKYAPRCSHSYIRR